MAIVVYVLSALTCLTCAFLLLRGYARSRNRLLMWTAICFSGLSVNNVLLVVDASIGPIADLSLPRLVVGLISVTVLVTGIAWDVK